MERLTVNEAAERLGVTTDAVRKRVPRCTLPSTKGPDGHVHVYMDTNAASGEGSGSEESSTDSGFGDLAKSIDIPTLLTSFAAIATLVYILGIFSLWAPIWRTYTHDIDTAWQAVSLVPRTVVIGLGVKHLIALPLFITITIGIVIVVLHRFFLVIGKRIRRSSLEGGGDEEPTPEHTRVDVGSFIWIVIALTLIYAGWRIAAELAPALEVSTWALAILTWLILVVVPYVTIAEVGVLLEWNQSRSQDATDEDHTDALGEEKQQEQPENKRRYPIVLYTITAVSFLVVPLGPAWLLIIGPRFPLREFGALLEGDFLLRTVVLLTATLFVLAGASYAAAYVTEEEYQDWSDFLLTVAVVLVATFLASFTLTFINNPPLPPVVVEVGEGNSNVKGELLTHVDAHWYVFNNQGNLVAIPDREVREAEICSPHKAQTTDFCP
jgi:hypothetical protein